MKRAVIVDDDVLTHKLLKTFFKVHFPEIDVIGQAYSVNEGRQVVNECEPDVIFVDVEMPDGKGYELVKELEMEDFCSVMMSSLESYEQLCYEHGANLFLVKPIHVSDVDELVGSFV